MDVGLQTAERQMPQKGLACMQAQLLDSLFGTERGLSASSEVRAEINELITQLEAKSPNSDMMEVPPKSPSSCASSQLVLMIIGRTVATATRSLPQAPTDPVLTMKG